MAAVMERQDRRDIISLMRLDHNEVKQLFTRFESATATDEKAQIRSQIVRELTRHEASEEQVFWPEVRQGVPDGASLASAGLNEEQQGTKLMAEINAMDPGDPELRPKMSLLKSAVLAHATNEETLVWPKVVGSIDSERLIAMGQRFQEAKQDAPDNPEMAMQAQRMTEPVQDVSPSRSPSQSDL